MSDQTKPFVKVVQSDEHSDVLLGFIEGDINVHFGIGIPLFLFLLLYKMSMPQLFNGPGEIHHVH